jgi:hypothetical protein
VKRAVGISSQQPKGQAVTMKYTVNGVEKLHKCQMEMATGRITFPHPDQPEEYDVICSSLTRTQFWLKSYYNMIKPVQPATSGWYISMRGLLLTGNISESIFSSF